MATPGVHPVPLPRAKTQAARLYHLSWSQIRTEALMEQSNKSVSDPDQAWILAEFIRYLEHPRSGALDFDDMGPSWVHVRRPASIPSAPSLTASAALDDPPISFRHVTGQSAAGGIPMHPPDGSTTPSRAVTVMRRLVRPSWEYRHRRAAAGVRFAGGGFNLGIGLVLLSIGRSAGTDRERRKYYGLAAWFLVSAPLQFLGGYLDMTVDRSAPPRT